MVETASEIELRSPRRESTRDQRFNYVRKVGGYFCFQARIPMGPNKGDAINLGIFSARDWNGPRFAEEAANHAAKEFVRRFTPGRTVWEVIQEMKAEKLVPERLMPRWVYQLKDGAGYAAKVCIWGKRIDLAGPYADPEAAHNAMRDHLAEKYPKKKKEKKFRKRRERQCKPRQVYHELPESFDYQFDIRDDGKLRGMPLSMAFTGFAYLRHLAKLRKRASANLPLFGDDPREKPATVAKIDEPEEERGKVRQPPLPWNRAWDSLKVVNCSHCGTVLLAECEELTRKKASPTPLRPQPLLCLPLLPPPVAMRAGGRPYCEGCVDKPVKVVKVAEVSGKPRIPRLAPTG